MQPPTTFFILGKKERSDIVNRAKGIYGEFLVQKFLQQLGYSVFKTTLECDCNGTILRTINVKMIEHLDKNHKDLAHYLRLHQDLDMYNISLRQRFNGKLYFSVKGLPDLLCIKKDKVFFVENKTKKENVTTFQKKKIKELTSYGYKVFITCIPVKLNEHGFYNEEISFYGVELEGETIQVVEMRSEDLQNLLN